MDSLDRQVLQQARDWRAAGRAVWLVTVVQTWGSAPRAPGALLAVRDDGQVVGSVSGGCVEDDLIERVRHGERVDRPSLVCYGVSRAEAARFGLPCGGTLRLVQEPLADVGWIDEVLSRSAAHALVARVVDLDGGTARLEPARRDEPPFAFDGRTMRSVYGPRWRMLVVGAGALSRDVARIARLVDFDVTCCDPRDSHDAAWDLPDVTLSRAMPDDAAIAMALDAHSAVVALTHDPKLDDMVLLEALKSPAFYVGALGSRATQARRRERLALFDLTAAQIARLHGPVGLDLGSRTPAEIAVSIVAEVIAARNGVDDLRRNPPATDAGAIGAPFPTAACAMADGAAARGAAPTPGSPSPD